MATQLKNIVRFVNIAPATPTALPHNLNFNGADQTPDIVLPSTGGWTYAVTNTTVTATNNTGANASIDLYVEAWHTYGRAFGNAATVGLTPRPFVPDFAASASVPDSYTPPDGTWNLVGNIEVSGNYLASGAAPEIRVITANDGWTVLGNRDAADAGVDVVVRSTAIRSAGQVMAVRNTVTNLFTVDFAGDATIKNSLSIGTAPIVAGTAFVLDVSASFGEITGDRDGVFSSISADASIGPVAHVLSGFSTTPGVGSANTQNWTDAVGVRGYTASPGSSPGSAGTITGMAGFYAADPQLFGAAVLARSMGVYVEAMTAGTTDNVGIWIEAPSGGATLNDAIHVVGGRTFIGGTVQIDQAKALGGGAAPSLGTIGGTGPTAAAQNEWIQIDTQNGARFVAAWA